MIIIGTLWTEISALRQLLEHDALALITTVPTETLRLAHFVFEIGRAGRRPANA